MGKKLAVLFVIGVLLSCCGCIAKEAEAPIQRPNFSASLDPEQWGALKVSAGFTAKQAIYITNERYESMNLSLDPGIYQTYYSENSTVAVKGVIPAESLPYLVLISDSNMEIWLDPIVVSRNPEIYENVLFTGCISMNVPHDVTFQASLVDGNGSMTNTSGKMASDRKINGFNFYYPVKKSGEIAGVEFNATYVL